MEPCIEWSGTRFAKSNYGRIGSKRAHRVVWEEAHGLVPRGLLVLHKCDNPPCINLDHLYVGTHADNARDRKERDRGVKGTRVNTNKLDEDQVQEIRWLANKHRHIDVASQYGISEAMVGLIDRGKSWGWLERRPRQPVMSVVLAVRLAAKRRMKSAEEISASHSEGARKGADNHSAKLNEKKVMKIKQMLQEGHTQQSIADEFAVKQSAISSIKNNKTWTHVFSPNGH